ncbi:SET and WW domain protein [Paecilomyces variotii No. 5]|uniref:Histone-lysine N-methyltransferase, H3 lysine-36 specific n=1 Tax=Byssochlamys spectabilis (strain No. 5 / NBRC 109023) TaxID=1356009 RepID=V5G0Q5_BYSSN|nr:SET and WW domain protein [Paecilomyces variotii No. 5]
MSTHDLADVEPESVAAAVTDIKLEDAPDSPDVNGGSKHEPASKGSESPAGSNPAAAAATNGVSSSSVKSRSTSRSPVKKDDDGSEVEEKVGGDITVKMEPGQPPKLSRSASQKITRPPQLFNHLPDSTADAKATFQMMEECTYANKYMGYTEHAMDCDCAEEWDPVAGRNHACGEDSDCINRATKMECVGDCGCGSDCQNQRFQRKEYAKVAVIKTDKKGFGLRAEMDLRPHQFIFEYVGEVINEAHFRRRMRQYDEEGIKHFYFMSLSKGEFVDATKRGNLGRFCNHSCNPNCYVDKWVVGEKLRMGIFAERHIKEGEELVFNYNVDRYGADPQPCYCGEPNCTGFIGGKTQTERATKLSNATIEALGIEDGDDWDTAVAKKPRKKKTGEDDEEYVDSVQPKSLNEDGVTKVMAALMQCKEKWIAVKLLGRIQRCEDERVRNRVVKMHGYQILNSQLSAWKDDHNVVLQILDILDKFPRLTRNKIIDSKIESTVQPLAQCGDERVEKKAAALLAVWATLEVGYRIPRMKRDPTANASTPTVNQFARRESTRDERKRSKSRSRSRSRSIEAPRGPAAQGRGGHAHRPRPFRRQFNPLPAGWFAAEANGRTYYYSARGDTTWTRPTAPAPQPPPPPKPEPKDKALQDIIDGIMNAKEHTPKEKTATPATPQGAKPSSEKKDSKEKWRTYSEEKQKRLYENTLFPHVKYVMDKFKHKLPKEDLKRYAKDVAKKLVNSDFKNNRVEDPNKISEKQQKQVKKFCKEYFDKAVVKHRQYEKKRSERKAQEGREKGETPTDGEPKAEVDSAAKEGGSDDEDFKMSDNEGDDNGSASPNGRPCDKDPKQEGGSQISTPPAPPPPPGEPEDEDETEATSLKRKRDGNHDDDKAGDGEYSPIKRQRSQTPPPPPPPPPDEAGDDENRDEDHPMGELEDSSQHNDSSSNGKVILDHVPSGDLPSDRQDELKPSQMSIEGKV